MNDAVSVFRGIQPEPIMEISYVDVLAKIGGGQYQKPIEELRAIKDEKEYRKQKTRLPSVTFCGTFDKKRNKSAVKDATGFIIPDIDHVANVDQIIDSFQQDPFIWFAFRSPRGDGIKCAIRSEGIKNDADIKRFYDAVERYFRSVYGIKIDPACKDISRLTFVSWDERLFINDSPKLFDIAAWPAKKVPTKAFKPVDANRNWQITYGNKVLESAARDIAESQPGEQHITRLRIGRLIGGYIASGFISEVDATSVLENAVQASGAKNMQAAMKTITDAMENGKLSPIQVEEQPQQHDQQRQYKKNDDIDYYCDIDEALNDDDNVNNDDKVNNVIVRRQLTTVVNNEDNLVNNDDNLVNNRPFLTTVDDSGNAENDSATRQNLASLIKRFIETSTGYFTADQIDREFNLTSRREKQNRSKILHRYKYKKLVREDKKIKGRYHVIDTKIDFVDLESEPEETFPIILPFSLHEYLNIPKKGIIVLAGSSNAGKTAIVLNTLFLNLAQPYPLLYLMSEMAGSEYKSRLRKFPVPIEVWKKVNAASKSHDFDGAVQTHNPDGLTCIDFLEENDGEYFKMSSAIRDIYDALGTGCSFIAIQKRTDQDYARGGQATAEKARLYMSLDYLATQDQSIICSLKLIKVKEFIGRNLQNHEIHFRLSNGCILEPVTDWLPCGQVDRQQYVKTYESGNLITSAQQQDIHFMCIDGNKVRVKQEAVDRWRKSFPSIDVTTELNLISRQSFKRPFLKKSNYFFTLSGMLEKKHMAASKSDLYPSIGKPKISL